MAAAVLSTALALSFTLSPSLAPCQPSTARRFGASACAQQQLEPEEVVQKYGLEAGLFSALRKGGGAGGDGNDGKDGEDGKVTAGQLLKRYGGAYLLTSTSFAIVSFTFCYLAVDNGVDVAALLSKVGLEVIVPEQAGTIGLAYAIHKAASPIRFPPTVALTPVVAKRLFNNDGNAEQASTKGENYIGAASGVVTNGIREAEGPCMHFMTARRAIQPDSPRPVQLLGSLPSLHVAAPLRCRAIHGLLGVSGIRARFWTLLGRSAR
eukprot:CAMPEP_0115864818 /NCGR_PEP_ID=MMETSP0287-20121206/19398_1 /TAXON_ID=412157 /ORGANISM="Chrysochromulina rotalis, Strain UIO044" /LENGTH=264 /DNA_ID=CAMNT_0003319303 /DNA_START=21 /DNA_END=816 /DNA_ORIENTATION=-